MSRFIPRKIIEAMNRDDLEAIVNLLVECLYLGQDGWDPDREWDWDDIGYLSEALEDHGLAPKKKEEFA